MLVHTVSYSLASQLAELLPDALTYQTSGANLDSSYLGWRRRSGELTKMPPCYLGLRGCE